jgi:type III pantothenate kinase
MNLCIDIGNTRTKVAVFDADGSLVKLIIREDYTSGKLDKVLKKYEIEKVRMYLGIGAE